MKHTISWFLALTYLVSLYLQTSINVGIKNVTLS